MLDRDRMLSSGVQFAGEVRIKERVERRVGVGLRDGVVARVRQCARTEEYILKSVRRTGGMYRCIAPIEGSGVGAANGAGGPQSGRPAVGKSAPFGSGPVRFGRLVEGASSGDDARPRRLF